MTMVGEVEALIRLVLAAGLGAAIGWEREDQQKPAGVRTFSIVAMGAAVFSLVGLMAFGVGDPAARIAAQIVTGIGFIGAGTILHHRGSVTGLTTAAGIWGVAAIGMAAGFGLYILAIGGSIITFVVLRLMAIVIPHQSPDALPTAARADRESPEDH